MLPLILTLAGIVLALGRRAAPRRSAEQAAPALKTRCVAGDVEAPSPAVGPGERRDARATRLTCSTRCIQRRWRCGLQMRVPDVVQRGDYVYNLWQDGSPARAVPACHRGDVFEKARRSGSPCSTSTRSRPARMPWAFGGITCLSPTYVPAS